MNEYGEMDRYAINDLVRWDGKIYSTGGYFETCKPMRQSMEYDCKMNMVWIIDEHFCRRGKHIEDVENITLKYKTYKLARLIMHWACKPGGPIYNLSLSRFKACQSL
jgi:hypothetical protein